MERLFFVGPGRFSVALAQALVQARQVDRVVFCGRHPEPPNHPLFELSGVEYLYGLRRPSPDTSAVFLGVPDADLADMAWALGGQGSPGAPVPAFHASIAVSGEVLAPLHGQGYTVGTFHPFAVLDGHEDAWERLMGAPVLLSGERGAQAAGHRIVQALGGRVLQLPVTQRASASAAEAIVHAGARVVADIGIRVLREAGLAEEDARRVAASLTTSVAASAPDPTSLAGVDPRDEQIELHLRALPDDVREIYRLLLETGRARETER